MSDSRLVSLEDARSIIARAMVDERDSVPPRLGGVTLHAHQRAAAARLASLISTNGGAMLAEPVGLGKTYTSLAVAARLGERLLIATPASLTRMWSDALAACGLEAELITHEALSRGATPAIEPGVVIVDEAHRLRSQSTKRYAILADICRVAKVLLVTATPVQNKRSDLATQLALFLGRGAWELSDEELAAYVVRDSAREGRGQPRLDGPHRICLPSDDDCLEALLALPAPIPAKDESLAVALLTYGLVHQWTSSRAALVASLGRRRARGVALLAAIEAGRQPTRAEMTAWTHGDGAVQLAFPELVTADAPIEDVCASDLADALRRHDSAIVALIERLRARHDPDVDRAHALSRIRAQHPGERIIAFCQYTETVHALRSLLAREPGVAALTAHGARIAGGRASRDEVIAQFVPSGSGGRSVGAAERIDLLITTDLLSEGLNLQEASVIVHLDLPWNPARLDQRVGRALRLGSRHDAVTVYTIAPPASAERMLQIEARLRDKLSVAQHTVGIAGRILPSPLAVESERHGLAEQPRCGQCRAATVGSTSRSERDLSLHRDLGRRSPRCQGSSPSSNSRTARDWSRTLALGSRLDPRRFNARSSRATAAKRPSTFTARKTTLEQLRAWIAAQAAAATIDFRAASAARSRRAAARRSCRSRTRSRRRSRTRRSRTRRWSRR